jgi:hypothetical protein
MDWINLRIGKSTILCGRGIKSSVFITRVQFLDYLRKYQFLKKILPRGFSTTTTVIYTHISGRYHRHCTILTLGPSSGSIHLCLAKVTASLKYQLKYFVKIFK